MRSMVTGTAPALAVEVDGHAARLFAEVGEAHDNTLSGLDA